MFTHSKGAFCHLRVQMDKKPTEDGWVEAPYRGGNDFSCPQGKLGRVVFQEETAIPDFYATKKKKFQGRGFIVIFC